MNNNEHKSKNRNIFILSIIIVLGISYFFFIKPDLMSKSKEISYSDFINMVESSQVKKVEIETDTIKIFPKEGDNREVFQTANIKNDELVKTLLDNKVDVKGVDEKDPFFDRMWELMLSWGPIILIGYFLLNSFKSMDQSFANSKKGNFESYDVDDKVKVKFEDVAGQDEAKESLNEIVDFLHNSRKYKQIGAKLPKGCLLVGPPGTGKTLLAKAIAGESEVPFLSVSGSEFVEMFVGTGASRVRELFAKAKEYSSCIIFIDEIDAIGKNRDSKSSNNDEREQTLNQLLKEMDGFSESSGIVVIGATNRPETLDKALLRPGRFDRRITVDVPDLNGRIAIFKIHTAHVSLKQDIDYNELALATVGASGADIANIVNEAALLAVKNGERSVSQQDLLESIETIIAGKQRKNYQVIKREKKVIAVHEVGHALVGTKLKGLNAVRKITIIPRTFGSLGYTLNFPDEERNLSTKEDYLREIAVLLGGRASEDVILKQVTNGASNDLQRATKIAREMVTMYGLSPLGLVCYEENYSRFLDGDIIKNYSERTSLEIDRTVKTIIDYCYEVAVNIIKDNKKIIAEAGNLLLKFETIDNEQFIEIYNDFNKDDSEIIIDETDFFKNNGYYEEKQIVNTVSRTNSAIEQSKPNMNKSFEEKQPVAPEKQKQMNKETPKEEPTPITTHEKVILKEESFSIPKDIQKETPKKPEATGPTKKEKRIQAQKEKEAQDFAKIIGAVQQPQKNNQSKKNNNQNQNQNKTKPVDKKMKAPTSANIFEMLQSQGSAEKKASFKPKKEEPKKQKETPKEEPKPKEKIEPVQEQLFADESILIEETVPSETLFEDIPENNEMLLIDIPEDSGESLFPPVENLSKETEAEEFEEPSQDDFGGDEFIEL